MEIEYYITAMNKERIIRERLILQVMQTITATNYHLIANTSLNN